MTDAEIKKLREGAKAVNTLCEAAIIQSRRRNPDKEQIRKMLLAATDYYRRFSLDATEIILANFLEEPSRYEPL